MRTFLSVTAFAVAITLARGAEAAQCGPTDKVIRHLQSKYGETRRSQALANTPETMIAELYVAEAGTWTLVYTHPSGVSCIKASGTDWEFMADTPVSGPHSDS